MVNGKVQRKLSSRPPVHSIKGRLNSPSRSGPNDPRPYALGTRHAAVVQMQQGLSNHITHQQLRDQRIEPSLRSVRRWIRQRQTRGTFKSYKGTGNRRATVLRGWHQVLLATYVSCFPKANAFEKIAFVHSATGIMYDQSQITRAEQRMGLSRKKASTTARQAFAPHNVARRFAYWHLPYPVGIADIPMQSMIDIDESKLILEMVNRKHGKCLLERRCRETGLYGHGEGRLFLAAIAANGERWSDLSDRNGTDTAHFFTFIQSILTSIGHAGPGNPQRCFIMDNLNVHKHPTVLAAIHAHGHRVVFRTPYCPFDGPIEYFFNAVENNLRVRCYDIHGIDDLVADVMATMASHVSFQQYFQHVGYN